jgi:transcriptional regulator with XRE-family HTH domain
MGRTSASQNLGKNIKNYRLEFGLSQEKLGIAAGLSQTYISEVERGLQNASIKTMDKIAKALGVSISDLTDFNSYKLKDNSRTTRHL